MLKSNRIVDTYMRRFFDGIESRGSTSSGCSTVVGGGMCWCVECCGCLFLLVCFSFLLVLRRPVSRSVPKYTGVHKSTKQSCRRYAYVCDGRFMRGTTLCSAGRSRLFLVVLVALEHLTCFACKSPTTSRGLDHALYSPPLAILLVCLMCLLVT